MNTFLCRSCGSSHGRSVLDLGLQPLANNLLSEADLAKPEPRFPLRVSLCEGCWLLQITDIVPPVELFSEYLYFSSFSDALLRHAAEAAAAHLRDGDLGGESFVVEIASNDGYLLKNFVAAGVPCLGIEPAANIAKVAVAAGVPTLSRFFGRELAAVLAAQGRQADLILGNNVFAHVPDINGFVAGLAALLKPGGRIALEFPYGCDLVEHVEFDTVYHEHFSYLSLYTVDRIFKAAGLRVWNVEKLSTHGGSLRVYGCHVEEGRETTSSVSAVLAEEAQRGLQNLSTYQNFQAKANRVKDDLMAFLIEKKRAGKTVAAYGAAAKGNTLLNYAGVKPDLLPFVCDAALAKQGKFMPGSHIPILAPAELIENRPDYLLILPWNIAVEVKQQNIKLAELGTKFVTAVPELEVV